jgi:hypothetical protein
MDPEDKLHLGLYFTIERSKREEVCLEYFLRKIEGECVLEDLINHIGLE